MFLADAGEEADCFLHLLKGLVAAEDSNFIVLVTIRSDAYERLQTAPALEGLSQQTYSLPPLPHGAYQTVIEGPAERLKETARPLKIEPALTAALLADVEAGGAKDALPLLAFTLERLYLEHGGDGDLKLAEYQEIGGIRGSIEAAVERALKRADFDPAVPKDRTARLALLRRALIPWLAGIDPETGEPRRYVARTSEIPEETRPLVEHLIAERLLATDISPLTGERTIEPAHEALLRQWGLLQGWLEEDFAALATREGVRRAARDWAANAKDEAWLAHGGGRLDDAEALLRREDFAASLDPTDREYLIACRATESARRNRELEEAKKLAEANRKIAGRTRVGLVVASILALVAVGLALFGFSKAKEANQRATEAINNETVGLAALSAKALAEERPVNAVQLALAAWPRLGDPDRPQIWQVREALAAALPQVRERLLLKGHEDFVVSATFSPDGKRMVTASHDKTARVWNAATGAEIAVLKGHESRLNSAAFSPDGRRVVTASDDKTARVWDASTGAEIAVLKGHEGDIKSAAFSPDGTRVVTASADNTARVWDSVTGANISVLKGHGGIVNSAVFSPDGSRVVTGSLDQTARVWDARTGSELIQLKENDVVWSAVFSPEGKRVLTASAHNWWGAPC